MYNVRKPYRLVVRLDENTFYHLDGRAWGRANNGLDHEQMATAIKFVTDRMTDANKRRFVKGVAETLPSNRPTHLIDGRRR